MRIAMISKACLVGAYQRKLEELARFPDVDLMVIVPPSWKEGSRVIHLERAHTEGYDLVVEPLVFNGSFHLHVYPRLRRRLGAFRPDVVHIDEEPYNLATFHALRLSKPLGAAALWFSWQNLNRRYPLPFRLLEWYNLRHADYAIVGSEGAAAVWRDKGYAGPLAVIPQFGVDPKIFAPGTLGSAGDHTTSRLTPGAKDRDPAQGFVIGFVGRLVPEKGVDLLLYAVRDLPGLWRLHIVGDGPERDAIETQVLRMGLESRVTFEEGWLPSLRMPAFYRQLDALVLPSRTRPNWVEQFGRVLIEAMACGVPVIGSDCGEIPHVVGDAGLVFPEDDAPALRAQLEELMRDPDLWSSLSRRGRERVLKHFTQRAIAAQTMAVYREMVGR
ncbi:MAG: glycosyltransferase family 4 protein [Anaerolineae bacterium]|jgi:glycosyltransferase involved in cell wall biosynthesis